MRKRIGITDTSKPLEVEFTYSVDFYEDDLERKDRLSKNSDNRFVPSTFEIHWLSIINLFVLVLLLTAFLTVILMTVLKNDFSRYRYMDGTG